MSFELFAETTRNDIVESYHFGAAAIADCYGQISHQWGDVEQLVFPRSALKPFYAIDLVESGAADHFKLSDVELALSCASHLGQTMHSEAVSEWLIRLGLNVTDLACGSVLPDDEQHMIDVLAKGQGKCSIHHNCSGKHAGFLTYSMHKGYDLTNYHQITHPAQQNSLDILSNLADMDIRQSPMGIDGCGFPAPTMPLAELAYAVAGFANPVNLSTSRAKAVYRLHNAMAKEPYFVSGHGNAISDIMHITNGKILVKSGAEGIMTAAIPTLGLGIAIKIADGSARARTAVLFAILDQLNILTSFEKQRLQKHLKPKISNSRHEIVGEIRPTIRNIEWQSS
ncbi:MAG: asparaginase [Rhizobiales bacterium]|nr:asparaginase [Hyphomicrobiales bacterium]